MAVALAVAIPNSKAQGQLINKKEEVFLHINSAELVVGETLLFSAYVRSNLTGKVSSLSRILYVELLDSESNSVWQSKILLENGRGAGDLFLSSLLSTGNYHLVAYTQWMKNFNDLYEQEIIIYNPFEYYKPNSDAKGQPTVEMFPVSGFLHADRENELVIKAAYADGAPFQTKGRIVNAEGDNLQSFETNGYGLTNIKFSPAAGQNYRIIAESETGDFLFFDVPVACSDCTLLSVQPRKNDFLVQLKKGNLPAWLEVVDGQNRYFSRTIEDNESFTVLRNRLPKGFAQIKLWTADKSELISTHNILNNAPEIQEVSGLKTFRTRTKLEESFSVEEGATVSVSVSKKYNNNLNAFNLAYDHGTVQFLNPGFRKSAGDTDLIEQLQVISKPEIKPLNPNFTPRYLAEYRSDQLHGKLTDETGARNRVVTAAVMNGQLELARPDSEGNVTLSIHPEKEGTEVLAKLMGDYQDVEIVWENEFYENYPAFNNTPLDLDSAKVAALAERSIKNQVQNVYYAFNPDSLINTKLPFAEQFLSVKSYRLDAFTRFPTMRDTFIEYVEEVAVNKNENNFNLRVRLWDSAEDHPSDTTELILIDGVPFSSKEALEISPYGISAIHIVPYHYYSGEVTLKGILMLETLEKDLSGLKYKQYNINYVGVQGKKKYRRTDHTDPCKEPDYRDQLLWIPQLDSQEGKIDFDFFTSDIPGTYEIRVEGITASGDPISIKKSFIVE
ncbi:MAG: hypothetical protein R8G66_25395 [Cytophagales bacterium]|nr:hypothetical protein [Cytophagales bacterium]